MKRICIVMLGVAILSVTPLVAAPARLEALAEKLARTASDLASTSYRGFLARYRGNRADVEALFLAEQFSAAATLFHRMVVDRRPASELESAAAILTEQLRSADRLGFGRRTWQEMAATLDQIGRELSGARAGLDDYDVGNRVSGRMRWRGTVDNEVHIFIQGANSSPRAIAGAPVTSSSFNFTSPLPRRNVLVQVKKLKGRGAVEIIQQPSRDNDFTAVIQIRDPKGGADDYEFEIVW